MDGGDIDFVEGYGGAPRIEGDAPPVRYIDLVTDGGDEDGGDAAGTEAPRGAPEAPVIHTINPDAGVLVPPVGDQPPAGDPGLDNLGLLGGSSAATAATADAAGGPGIAVVGANGGAGIQSTAPAGDDDVLGHAPAAEAGTVIGAAGPALPDAGAADGRQRSEVEALDAAAADAPARETPVEELRPAADLVAAGLAADLSTDPVVSIDPPPSVTQLDPGGADLLEGSVPGLDDDGFDG